jgi:hypothetical protein
MFGKVHGSISNDVKQIVDTAIVIVEHSLPMECKYRKADVPSSQRTQFD